MSLCFLWICPMKRKKNVGVGWGLERKKAEGGQCTWGRDVPETERCLCIFSWFGCCSPTCPLGLTWALVPGSWNWGSCSLSRFRVAGQSVQGSKFRPVKVSGDLAGRLFLSDTDQAEAAVVGTRSLHSRCAGRVDTALPPSLASGRAGLAA